MGLAWILRILSALRSICIVMRGRLGFILTQTARRLGFHLGMDSEAFEFYLGMDSEAFEFILSRTARRLVVWKFDTPRLVGLVLIAYMNVIINLMTSTTRA